MSDSDVAVLGLGCMEAIFFNKTSVLLHRSKLQFLAKHVNLFTNILTENWRTLLTLINTYQTSATFVNFFANFYQVSTFGLYLCICSASIFVCIMLHLSFFSKRL